MDESLFKPSRSRLQGGNTPRSSDVQLYGASMLPTSIKEKPEEVVSERLD